MSEEKDMAPEETWSPQERILLELAGDQNFRAAVLGGTAMVLLAGLLAYPVTLMTGNPIRIYGLFVGVLVAFGVRNWGRGLDRRFNFLGLGLTLVALVLATIVSETTLVVERSRYDMKEMLTEYMNPAYAWNLLEVHLGFVSGLFWLIGLALGYSGSVRRLDRALLGRLRREGVDL